MPSNQPTPTKQQQLLRILRHHNIRHLAAMVRQSTTNWEKDADYCLKAAIGVQNGMLVQDLLALGADPLRNNHCVELAARHGDAGIVQLLLDHGGKATENVLKEAVEHGHVSVLACVHRNNPRLLETPHTVFHGEPMLVRATDAGHADVVAFLLQNSTNISQDVFFWAQTQAAEMGALPIVRMLVQHAQSPPRIVCDTLLAACANGHLEVAQWFAGCVGAVQQEAWDHSLSAAAYGGYVDIVQWLLDKGANAQSNHSKALQYASVQQHSEVLKLLYPHSDAQDALRGLAGKPDTHKELLAAHMAQEERKILSTHVDNTCRVDSKRKMI